MGATATQVRTSGGKPTGQQKPAPRPAAPAASSSAVKTAVRSGEPAVSLGAPVARPEPIGVKIADDEIDLSTGELAVPAATADALKDGGELDAKVRLPGLAEGTIRVRKRGASFSTVGPGHAILLRHPALAGFATATPTVLVVEVKEGKVGGWVGTGLPGQPKGTKRGVLDAMSKGAALLGWAGLSKITFPTFRNQFDNGVIDLAADNLAFTVGGFLSGTGSVALDNKALAFEGGATVEIPGGSKGELVINKDASGALAGKLAILVQIGKASGTVTATLSRGFVSVMGTVGYSGDRLSGKITLVATDEPTARDITLKKPEGGGDVPIELPGPGKEAKPGPRAFCGWGHLTFQINDWLAGTAAVIVNSKGQATIVGEIAPPKEFLLFEKKPWEKPIFKLEIRAGYGIPVVGQVALFANIGLAAVAEVGPGKLRNIKLAGAYSTDPRVPKALSLEGTINISAYAGLRLRAEAGLVVTILGHDIKAGVGLNAFAGVRGYVEATPRIGMRETTPGQRQYYIQGHMEIAAQPVLGFSGDLFVAIETPWWSPLSDKRWTWPLFSIEYPLPGEFGIGADVDYVLGSKQWPKIEFGEVDFDGSKFLSDVMGDNTDTGGGGDTKEPGEWKEGLAGSGPGGAKNKGGKPKTPQDPYDDVGPIGPEMTFSDGQESHRLWIQEKGIETTTLMASESPADVVTKIAELEKCTDELLPADLAKAHQLLPKGRKQAAALDKAADELAVKKEAAKNAKKFYEKYGKNLPRGMVKPTKKDLKKAKKEVRDAEKALKDTMAELTTLFARKPFKQIERKAEMWGGGKEAAKVVNDKTHAGLRVSEMNRADKLDKVTLGPVGKATNKKGETLVSTAGVTVSDQADKVEKAQIRKGKINARFYETLTAPVELAAQAVGPIGQKMKIQKLDRAMRKERIPKGWLKPQILAFPANPATPAGSKVGAYRRKFFKEMDRQLKMQEQGLNRLTVDAWVRNLMLFSMNPERFKELDRSARLELIEELDERAKKALDRTLKRIARLESERDDILKQSGNSTKTLAEIDAEIARAAEKFDRLENAQKEIDVAAAKNQQGDAVAPQRDILAPIDPRSLGKKYLRRIPLRILGRLGKESRVKYRLNDHRDKLLALMKEWDGLALDASGLAVLHNPDQVAGGYDAFAPLPKEPQDWTDEKEVRAFLLKMKRFYGPGVVNSAIGKEWKGIIDKQAYPGVTSAVPQEAYGINLLNFTLKRKS